MRQHRSLLCCPSLFGPLLHSSIPCRITRSLSPFSDLLPPRRPNQKLELQAETRQLLDIVTHSIYTDKEVFLRELISNASDAMEKLRHLQVVGEAVEEGSAPMEITITTDEEEKTITIQDTVREMEEGVVGRRQGAQKPKCRRNGKYMWRYMPILPHL